ncbi:TM1812 family CRISPR-associated protein [Pyrobaculum calidifontis]|uniref:CRISPR system endoribonuclease Csx1 CARF domain-containing protein n=1 Tax=Pyrobaculum calidifontis (strain DSM 21063 / JCM 11548 / VA1) TaxID=410359 RepID=A3MVN7_PYRCJ|nr:TM1812 family CRISPR-associated protein [Pyrobaculum calidifontis]ABO08704.1 hypothetical protein Pcal_1280 [Pyrobaculum calidifontis JCM 11548]
MGSGGGALVWLGGDVSQYRQVTYVVDGSEYRSFISAAALARAKSPAKLAVIVPETLFEEGHCESYRKLLEAKSRYGGRRLFARESDSFEDAAVHELLRRGFDCYVVPHPGIASPLRLVEEGNEVRVERGGAREFPSYGFNLVFSSVYLILSKYAKDSGRLYVDVTHGTNVLISATLLAAALLPIAYDAEVEIYAAPVMVRVEEGARVEFLRLDEATRAVGEVAAGGQAWKWLDERLLPVRYYREVGERLGKYRDVYSGVNALLKKGAQLLWALRSGQLVAARRLVEELGEELEEAEQKFSRLVSQELPLDDKPHEEWGRHAGEPPWPPVTSIALTLTKRAVSELRSGTNVEFVQKGLRLLAEREYADRALSIAREWAVALSLWRKGTRGEAKVGDSEWAKAEADLVKRDPVFERVRQYRNRLMHGRLSRDDNARLKLSDRDIEVELPTGLIDKEELNKLANELLKKLEEET